MNNVKWIVVGSIGTTLIIIATLGIISRVQEQERVSTLKKEIERQRMAEQLKKFNAEQDKFRNDRNLAARLEELRRATEREQFRFAHNLEIDPDDNWICVVGRANLFSYFPDDDLNFLLNRKNRYTVRYADIFDKGNAKAIKELKEREDELRKLKEAIDALLAARKE